MLGTPLPSDDPPARAGLDGVRVAGGVSIRIENRHGRSAVADVLERDGYKVRFPRGGENPEAVIINTGGGLVGGDRRPPACHGRAGRAGNSDDPVLGAGLPRAWRQRDHCRRAPRARRGRHSELAAAGDHPVRQIPPAALDRDRYGGLRASAGRGDDRFRPHRDGRNRARRAALRPLAGAAATAGWSSPRTFRLDGDIAATLAKTAVAGGAHVVSTLLTVRDDAEDLLEPVRAALGGADCEAGATAWSKRLIVRALGRSSEGLRRMVGRVIPILSGGALPRVWQT